MSTKQSVLYPELRSLQSVDLERPQLPKDPLDCCVAFQAQIGLKGQTGADTFQFEVATPRYFLRDGESRWGRGLLLVSRFEWNEVDRMLARLLAHSSGTSWDCVSVALNRVLEWEFDDYQAYVG